MDESAQQSKMCGARQGLLKLLQVKNCIPSCHVITYCHVTLCNTFKKYPSTSFNVTHAISELTSILMYFQCTGLIQSYNLT